MNEVLPDLKREVSDFLDCIDALIVNDDTRIRQYRQRYFRIAETAENLKALGLKGNYFTIRFGVVARHFKKDKMHLLGVQQWKDVIDNINTPIIVTRYETGFRLWTRAQINNNSIVVGVDIRMVGRNLFVNSIATAFGANKSVIRVETLIYPAEIKEISPNDLSVLTGRNPRT